MKLFKLGIHFWITLTSVFSFLVGWMVLAHSPKPVQAQTISTSPSSVTVAPLPTLVPIQTLNLDSGNGGGFQSPQFNIQQAPPPPPAPVQQMMPIFRTSGS
jgi:hypothetical protein